MDIKINSAPIIWMIDDDEIQQYCFEKSLELQGISKQCIKFFDGENAINFFRNHPKDLDLLPDVIFLDLNMPIVNGWQFLQQYALIKTGLKKQAKIYVLSSSQNADVINKAASIPEVSGYISKPLKPEDISEILGTKSKKPIPLVANG
ncbi:MAG: response regulator [Sphingobacteriaceae bacterium]|nr:response regulator [Sphingobacteriaceae bacterium]